LKNGQQIFDHSFNTEIIRVSAAGLFEVLKQIFGTQALGGFDGKLEMVKKEKSARKRQELFKDLAFNIASGAVS
jgi:hypothetical protein